MSTRNIYETPKEELEKIKSEVAELLKLSENNSQMHQSLVAVVMKRLLNAVKDGEFKKVDDFLTTPNAINKFGKIVLDYAIKSARLDAIKHLHSNPKYASLFPTKPDGKNPTLYSPLHIAAQEGHGKIVSYLVETVGISVNSPDGNQKTPLMYALQLGTDERELSQGKKQVASFLLRCRNVDLNVPDAKGQVALDYAIAADNKGGIAMELASHGANPALLSQVTTQKADPTLLASLKISYDEYVKQQLLEAVVAGDLQTVKKFLNDENYCSPIYGQMNILQLAIHKGQLEIIKYLHERLKDLNTLDPYPLKSAILAGHVNVVNYLINDAKMDVNEKAVWEEGLTLTFAASKGRFNVIAFLIEQRVDIGKMWDKNNIHLAKLFLDYVLRAEKYDIAEKLLQNAGDMGAELQALYDELIREALFEAVEKGDLKGVEKYLNDRNYNAVNKEGKNILHVAARNGHKHIVEFLYKNEKYRSLFTYKTDVCNESLTPLHEAAIGGHLEIIRYLVDETGIPCDILAKNGITPYSITPLVVAITNTAVDERKCIEMISFFIKKGTDLNRPDGFGRRPLDFAFWSATSSGRKEVCKFLVTNGADPGLLSPTVKEQAGPLLAEWKSLYDTHLTKNLLTAIQKNDLGSVKKFADKKGDLSVDSKPLFDAILQGRKEIVHYLINDGKMDVNSRDLSGATALMAAVLVGEFEIATVLIKKGAPVDEQTTEAWIREVQGNKVELELLYQLGSYDALRPLYECIEKKLFEAVEKGDLKGVEKYLNARNYNAVKDGKNILHLAAEKGFWDVVFYLVNTAQMSVDLLDSQGQTPLMYALHRGEIESSPRTQIADYLVRKGADLNTQDEKGQTALGLAIANGNNNKTIARHLVTYGANPALLSQAAKVTAGKRLLKRLTTSYNEYLLEEIQRRVEEGKLEAVKRFFNDKDRDAVCDINRKIKLLYHAIDKGHIEVVQYLVKEKGVSCNALDANGLSPIMRALDAKIASEKKAALVDFFIERGADLNTKNKAGVTALACAIEHREEKIAKTLAASGADPRLIIKPKKEWAQLLKGLQSVYSQFLENINQPAPVSDKRKPLPITNYGSRLFFVRSQVKEEDKGTKAANIQNKEAAAQRDVGAPPVFHLSGGGKEDDHL